MTFEEKKKIVIGNYFKSECNINMTIEEAYTKGFERGLSKAPKIEHKTGKWEEEKYDAIIHGHCSSCGWSAVWQETDVFGMPYCPNCGARMENENE